MARVNLVARIPPQLTAIFQVPLELKVFGSPVQLGIFRIAHAVEMKRNRLCTCYKTSLTLPPNVPIQYKFLIFLGDELIGEDFAEREIILQNTNQLQTHSHVLFEGIPIPKYTLSSVPLDAASIRTLLPVLRGSVLPLQVVDPGIVAPAWRFETLAHGVEIRIIFHSILITDPFLREMEAGGELSLCVKDSFGLHYLSLPHSQNYSSPFITRCASPLSFVLQAEIVAKKCEKQEQNQTQSQQQTQINNQSSYKFLVEPQSTDSDLQTLARTELPGTMLQNGDYFRLILPFQPLSDLGNLYQTKLNNNNLQQFSDISNQSLSQLNTDFFQNLQSNKSINISPHNQPSSFSAYVALRVIVIYPFRGGQLKERQSKIAQQQMQLEQQQSNQSQLVNQEVVTNMNKNEQQNTTLSILSNQPSQLQQQSSTQQSSLSQTPISSNQQSQQTQQNNSNEQQYIPSSLFHNHISQTTQYPSQQSQKSSPLDLKNISNQLYPKQIEQKQQQIQQNQEHNQNIDLYSDGDFTPALPFPTMESAIDVGHRGSGANARHSASIRLPVLRENTLSSFLSAAQANVGWVELDVHLTSDEVPVINHDYMLPLTNKIDIPICRLSAKQFVSMRRLITREATLPIRRQEGIPANSAGVGNFQNFLSEIYDWKPRSNLSALEELRQFGDKIQRKEEQEQKNEALKREKKNNERKKKDRIQKKKQIKEMKQEIKKQKNRLIDKEGRQKEEEGQCDKEDQIDDRFNGEDDEEDENEENSKDFLSDSLEAVLNENTQYSNEGIELFNYQEQYRKMYEQQQIQQSQQIQNQMVANYIQQSIQQAQQQQIQSQQQFQQEQQQSSLVPSFEQYIQQMQQKQIKPSQPYRNIKDQITSHNQRLLKQQQLINQMQFGNYQQQVQQYQQQQQILTIIQEEEKQLIPSVLQQKMQQSEKKKIENEQQQQEQKDEKDQQIIQVQKIKTNFANEQQQTQAQNNISSINSSTSSVTNISASTSSVTNISASTNPSLLSPSTQYSHIQSSSTSIPISSLSSSSIQSSSIQEQSTSSPQLSPQQSKSVPIPINIPQQHLQQEGNLVQIQIQNYTQSSNQQQNINSNNIQIQTQNQEKQDNLHESLKSFQSLDSQSSIHSDKQATPSPSDSPILLSTIHVKGERKLEDNKINIEETIDNIESSDNKGDFRSSFVDSSPFHSNRNVPVINIDSVYDTNSNFNELSNAGDLLNIAMPSTPPKTTAVPPSFHLSPPINISYNTFNNSLLPVLPLLPISLSLSQQHLQYLQNSQQQSLFPSIVLSPSHILTPSPPLTNINSQILINPSSLSKQIFYSQSHNQLVLAQQQQLSSLGPSSYNNLNQIIQHQTQFQQQQNVFDQDEQTVQIKLNGNIVGESNEQQNEQKMHSDEADSDDEGQFMQQNIEQGFQQIQQQIDQRLQEEGENDTVIHILSSNFLTPSAQHVSIQDIIGRQKSNQQIKILDAAEKENELSKEKISSYNEQEYANTSDQYNEQSQPQSTFQTNSKQQQQNFNVRKARSFTALLFSITDEDNKEKDKSKQKKKQEEYKLGRDKELSPISEDQSPSSQNADQNLNDIESEKDQKPQLLQKDDKKQLNYGSIEQQKNEQQLKQQSWQNRSEFELLSGNFPENADDVQPMLTDDDEEEEEVFEGLTSTTMQIQEKEGEGKNEQRKEKQKKQNEKIGSQYKEQKSDTDNLQNYKGDNQEKNSPQQNNNSSTQTSPQQILQTQQTNKQTSPKANKPNQSIDHLAKWEVSIDDDPVTLATLLVEAPKKLGLIIEVKYATEVFQQAHHFQLSSRNRLCDRILETLIEYGADREKIVLTCFDPEVVIMLLVKQSQYNVFFNVFHETAVDLSSNCNIYADDVRAISMAESIIFTKVEGAAGLCENVTTLLRYPRLALATRRNGMALMSYGEKNVNKDVRDYQRRALGVTALICDNVHIVSRETQKQQQLKQLQQQSSSSQPKNEN